jgi:hypothetical protein
MPNGSKIDSEFGWYCSDATGQAQKLALGAAAQRTDQLSCGLWEITASAACFIRQGGSEVTAVEDVPSHYLPANVPRQIHVSSAANAFLSAIATGGGTLYANPY